jgi:Uma2 family endonuclease
MAILEHEIMSSTLDRTGVQRFVFTRQAYYALGEAGVLDNRVELIEGEIVEMPPIGPTHGAVPEPLVLLLQNAFGHGFSVRNQAAISIGEDSNPSDPQPDIAVVAGTWRDYLHRQPKPEDVRLAVEVADSSLGFDRKIKGVLYASAGIPEYWIVNLAMRQVEVYRDPVEAGYLSTVVYEVGQAIEPLHAPGKTVNIADFMP